MKKILVFVAIVIAVISTSCNHQENTIQQYLKDNSNSGWAKVVDMKVDTVNFTNSYVTDSLTKVMNDYLERSMRLSEISKDELEQHHFAASQRYMDASDTFHAKAMSISETILNTPKKSAKICRITVKYRELNELGNKVINDCLIYADTDFKNITKNPIELTKTL